MAWARYSRASRQKPNRVFPHRPHLSKFHCCLIPTSSFHSARLKDATICVNPTWATVITFKISIIHLDTSQYASSLLTSCSPYELALVDS